MSGDYLNSKGPKANLKDVPTITFLHTLKDQQRQRSSYKILTARILADALSPLKNACVRHILHECTNAMSQKSKKVDIFYTLFMLNVYITSSRLVHPFYLFTL